MSWRKTRILAAAQTEAYEAFRWYEQEERGVGERFRAAIRRTLESIRANPLRFPSTHDTHVRRALVKNFPYAVFFSTTDNEILIIAIFHTSRDPETLLDRDLES
jgi:plasmid stabilization system protein ParE